MKHPIRLGISTCPNDLFAFAALMERRVDWGELTFQLELLDVEALNQGLQAGRFDVAKGSFHAGLLLSRELLVLRCGAALGHGVGPVLLAAPGRSHPAHLVQGEPPLVLAPGAWTTASLLYRLFHPGEGRLEQVLFSRIMPALRVGQADFGVAIHEGRFTYQEQGLTLVEDLGQRYEEASEAALPLGGIFGRRVLGRERLLAVEEVIRASLLEARLHPEAAFPLMRRYAQEQRDAVLQAHVDLYVNAATLNLEEEGARALQTLSALARKQGLLQGDQPPLEILS